MELPKTQFRSDHGRIELMIPKVIDELHQPKGSKRFSLKSLLDPTLQAIIQRDWAASQTFILEIISKAHNRIQLLQKIPDRDVLLEIVDTIYDTLRDEIISLCERHFQQYDPEDIQGTADQSINDKMTNIQAIRNFKRSQRSFQKQKKFIPRTSNNVLTEAQNLTPLVYIIKTKT